MECRRPRLAVFYGASCGGCDVSLVNVGEDLCRVLEGFDVVYWSIAVDTKFQEVEKLSDIDVVIFIGSPRTEDHVKVVNTIKGKAKLVVAYGTCACYGGIPGLSFLLTPEEILKVAKSTVTTLSTKLGSQVTLPELLSEYRPLSEYIEPNILVPGCPPPTDSIKKLIEVLEKYVTSRELVKRLVIGGEKSLCEECPRKPKEVSKLVMPKISRLFEVVPEGGKCFLEQGILCLGPVTRSGCGHLCIKANTPCVGCMGPIPNVDDVGIKFISVLSSVLLADREREVGEEYLAKVLDKVVDLQGTLYRYTLPISYLAKIALKRRLRT